MLVSCKMATGKNQLTQRCQKKQKIMNKTQRQIGLLSIASCIQQEPLKRGFLSEGRKLLMNKWLGDCEHI